MNPCTGFWPPPIRMSTAFVFATSGKSFIEVENTSRNSRIKLARGTAGSKITVHLLVQSETSEVTLPAPGLVSERIECEFDDVLDRLNKALQEQHISLSL